MLQNFVDKQKRKDDCLYKRCMNKNIFVLNKMNNVLFFLDCQTNNLVLFV